ncbi:MAG TPA: UDP-N-acetylmuramate dehydrogenase [Halanaerobiales bacterium]|nr:UDP-N-acetylmuramate dehydrogenase [Halanaerobiales bacterium]
MDLNFKEKLKEIKNLEIREKQPLKKISSFKIGGPADIFLIPHSCSSLQEVISLLSRNKLPFFIMGKATNLIISDRGIREIVIYTGELKNISIKGNRISAEAGISLPSLAARALEAGLSGLEFASGIPGSLGGALYMNAGAYGHEMKDIVERVYTLNYSGQEQILDNKKLGFSYRYSILQEKKLIATRTELLLKPGNYSIIKKKMAELNNKRREKQPLEYSSVGSIFKRPKQHYSGPLIEKAGMKGASIGDARVSTKHAGFIINAGKATAVEVLALIKRVREEVYKTSGIWLELEPKLIGDFKDETILHLT